MAARVLVDFRTVAIFLKGLLGRVSINLTENSWTLFFWVTSNLSWLLLEKI